MVPYGEHRWELENQRRVVLLHPQYRGLAGIQRIHQKNLVPEFEHRDLLYLQTR